MAGSSSATPFTSPTVIRRPLLHDAADPPSVGEESERPPEAAHAPAVGARPLEPVDLSSFEASSSPGEVEIPASLRASSAASNAYVLTTAIDGQIADVTRQLRSVHDDSARILAQKSLLDTIASAAQDAGKNGDKKVDLATLMIPTADGGTISAKDALARAGLLATVDSGGDGRTTVNALQSTLSSLDSTLNSVNSRTQLQMLQLQELTHQRGLFLQLATNDLAARQQIDRRIAENIR